MKNKTNNQAQRIALLALLTALTAILSYFGGFIKIGGLASINLTLVPVVLGAALQGVWSGAWLGLVSGAVFFLTADAAYWMGLSVPGTIITGSRYRRHSQPAPMFTAASSTVRGR